jgi:hypothetical protein
MMSGDQDPIVGGPSDRAPATPTDHPVIDGPPPSNWRPLLDAGRSMVTWIRRHLAVKPGRPSAKSRPAAAQPDDAEKADKAWIAVHGKPMLWTAPVFLAFAAVYAAPHLATLLSPDDPRALLKVWVDRLPDQAAPLNGVVAGWLWSPWWIGAPALLMRLNAARITARAIMDAVGWSMAALALEGAAWLYVGRKVLAQAAVPLAEREGAWQLLVAEFVFLFLAATVLGPHQPRPKYLNLNDR